ncbi:MAG: PLP-dependent aspartate aminotransferase family protein [bacterium]|nr:PLP-dependent aspartate aminotransferase family protein [bacterium]
MTDENKKASRKFETRTVQTGQVGGDETGAVSSPIFPSSTYRVKYPGDESGYVYSRWSNPTRQAVEEGLANLEEGSHAYAFASGLAALNGVMHLLKSGDHLVAVDDLYGGSHRQFEHLRRQYGIEITYIDGQTPENFTHAIKPNTRLFWLETPTNPLLRLVDIEAVVAIAREKKILVGVDNTFATPYLQKPLNLGADIVLHSLSKYLGGHCDLIGGALITNDSELAEKLRFSQYAVGGALGPFESWLVLRGMKTLHVRMDRHCENAAKVADFLKQSDLVEHVYYPGLDGTPLPNAMKQGGGMVSFDLKAEIEIVKQFTMATEVFVLAESLGGVESLVNHPALMTHASIPKEIRLANGITDGLIRLSVGLEHIDDLLADLRQALEKIRCTVRTA